MIIADTPEKIAFVRLATLKAGLSLEIKGMRMTRGRTAYSLLRDMGYTGSRAEVLAAVKFEIELQIAKQEKAPLTLAQLGEIMLKEAGAEACKKGYGTTDPEYVGRYALQYGDINKDGALN